MKKIRTCSALVGYLEMIFRILNREYFSDYLSMPVITIQSSQDTYGRFTSGSVWRVGDKDNKSEINISAEWLCRPIVNVVATMLHEMTHMFCYNMGIKDTSRGCTYHNKNFKVQAEQRGLLIAHTPKYGWTLTTPSPELIEFVKSMQWDDIDISRCVESACARQKKLSSTRKYQCPCCGMSVRATKAVRIMCMDCQKQMEVVS